MRESFKKYFGAFLELIYPPYLHCVSCRLRYPTQDSALCAQCSDALPWVGPYRCDICGMPVNAYTPICDACQQEQHAFTRAWAVFMYEGVIKRLIYRYKYSGEATLTAPFAQWMQNEYTALGWNAELIIPVPLHPLRRRQRGYNQAQLLAEALSKQLHIPIDVKLLLRIVNTKTQTKLGRHQRLENLKHAFKAEKSESIKGKTVLLVDDVYTTGATADQCSEVLKRAGAARVFLLTLALTPRYSPNSMRKGKKDYV